MERNKDCDISLHQISEAFDGLLDWEVDNEREFKSSGSSGEIGSTADMLDSSPNLFMENISDVYNLPSDGAAASFEFVNPLAGNNVYLIMGYAEAGDMTGMRKLLSANASLANASTWRGHTPLMNTTYRRRLSSHSAASLEVASLLLETAAEVDACDEGGWTALMWAAYHGNRDIAKLLLDAGASIDAQNNDGNTAMLLSSGRSYEVSSELVSRGANVNISNALHETALTIACSKGDTDTASLLLRAGALVNARDNSGYSALLVAAENGYIEVAHLLLSHGASVNLATRSGLTALHLCCQSRSQHSALFSSALVRRGADILVKDANLLTPLDHVDDVNIRLDLEWLYRDRVALLGRLRDRLGADEETSNFHPWALIALFST
eukprot:gene1460-2808_t